jgi:hypothetical protein
MDSLADIIKENKQEKKAPAYPWQELALQIINDLKIPNNKRSSVFKVCKENEPELIKRALNDTKELCKTGSAWRYFFKLIEENKKS